MEKTPAQNAKEKLDQIKYAMAIGRITYDQAKDYAQPYLDTLNKELAARARQAGLSTGRKITFTGYMR